jgi:hypothetical protein
MRQKTISIVMFSLCCLVVLAILACTPGFIHAVTKDSEGWGSMFFRFFAGFAAVGNAVLLAVCLLLYWKSARKLDLMSVGVSAATLIVFLLVLTLMEPLRQWLIFGR